MDKRKTELKQVPEPIQRHLLQQQRSKQTMKEYCQQNGILTQTFYGWRKRYGKRLFSAPQKRASTISNITFASLGALNSPLPRSALFDIRFPNGTSVCIYPGATVETVSPFLTLLAGKNELC